MIDRTPKWAFPLAVVGLTVAGLGLVTLGGRSESAPDAGPEPVQDPGIPDWSEADCAIGCSATGWLIAQVPCVRGAICAPGDGGLYCALSDGRSLRCGCQGFALVDPGQPEANSGHGLQVGLLGSWLGLYDGFPVMKGRTPFISLGAPMELSLAVEDGGVRELSVPLNVLPLPDESPLDRAFRRLEDGLFVICPAPDVQALGIKVAPDALEALAAANVADALAAASGVSQDSVRDSTPEFDPSSGLDSDALVHFVRARMRSIRHCAERSRKGRPSLAGKVVVRFVIGTTGRITDVEIDENTTGSDELANCLRSTIKVWTTPFRPVRDAVVSYPFLFARPQ